MPKSPDARFVAASRFLRPAPATYCYYAGVPSTVHIVMIAPLMLQVTAHVGIRDDPQALAERSLKALPFR